MSRCHRFLVHRCPSTPSKAEYSPDSRDALLPVGRVEAVDAHYASRARCVHEALTVDGNPDMRWTRGHSGKEDQISRFDDPAPYVEADRVLFRRGAWKHDVMPQEHVEDQAAAVESEKRVLAAVPIWSAPQLQSRLNDAFDECRRAWRRHAERRA